MWLMLMLYLLVSLAVAGTRPPPTDVPEGSFESAPRDITLSRGAVLTIVPTSIPPGTVLEYVWEESHDGGVTWREWTTGTLTGGPKTDRDGNVIAERQSIGRPSTTGAAKIRLKGFVKGQPVRISADVEEVGR